MSREEIIKQEAKRILHIALECEDVYEGQDNIEARLNILIDTLSLTSRQLGSEDDRGGDNNNSGDSNGYRYNSGVEDNEFNMGTL